MSDTHDLPEDLSQWPNDPYELLGVERGTPERDVRRAYTRLIRKYKPEQFPQHFQKIREAFETLLRWAEFQQRFHIQQHVEPTEPTPVASMPGPETRSVPESSESKVEPNVLPKPVSLSKQLQQLWQEIAQGDEDIVYAKLRTLSEQTNAHPEVCLRLYWLLVLYPHLDTERTRKDWLIAGLKRTGYTGPLRELYDDELTDFPEEALSERYASMLSEPLPLLLLVELLQRRWCLLVRQGGSGQIFAEFDTWKAKLRTQNDEAWLNLNCALLDELLWQHDDWQASRLKDTVRDEIKSLEYLFTRTPAQFDRMEYASSLALESEKPPGPLPAEVLTLASLYWRRPFQEIRTQVRELALKMAENPNWWYPTLLDELDMLPLSIQQLNLAINELERWLGYPIPEPETPAALALLLSRKLRSINPDSHVKFGLELLSFCQHEALLPDSLAHHLTTIGYWGNPPAGIAYELLVKDLPLRLVSKACLLSLVC